MKKPFKPDHYFGITPGYTSSLDSSGVQIPLFADILLYLKYARTNNICSYIFRSLALMATMTVLALMRIAPTAGLRSIP